MEELFIRISPIENGRSKIDISWFLFRIEINVPFIFLREKRGQRVKWWLLNGC